MITTKCIKMPQFIWKLADALPPKSARKKTQSDSSNLFTAWMAMEVAMRLVPWASWIGGSHLVNTTSVGLFVCLFFLAQLFEDVETEKLRCFFQTHFLFMSNFRQKDIFFDFFLVQTSLWKPDRQPRILACANPACAFRVHPEPHLGGFCCASTSVQVWTRSTCGDEKKSIDGCSHIICSSNDVNPLWITKQPRVIPQVFSCHVRLLEGKPLISIADEHWLCLVVQPPFVGDVCFQRVRPSSCEDRTAPSKKMWCFNLLPLRVKDGLDSLCLASPPPSRLIPSIDLDHRHQLSMITWMITQWWWGTHLTWTFHRFFQTWPWTIQEAWRFDLYKTLSNV